MSGGLAEYLCSLERTEQIICVYFENDHLFHAELGLNFCPLLNPSTHFIPCFSSSRSMFCLAHSPQVFLLLPPTLAPFSPYLNFLKLIFFGVAFIIVNRVRLSCGEIKNYLLTYFTMITIYSENTYFFPAIKARVRHLPLINIKSLETSLNINHSGCGSSNSMYTVFASLFSLRFSASTFHPPHLHISAIWHRSSALLCSRCPNHLNLQGLTKSATLGIHYIVHIHLITCPVLSKLWRFFFHHPDFIPTWQYTLNI